MSRFPVLAAATLAALTAVGCAATPDGSEDVDSTSGAAVGSMPERTTLYTDSGLVAYFDGGWAKSTVTLYRRDAKQTLRCEAQPFSVEDNGNTGDPNRTTTTSFRCFDSPPEAVESCQVIFNRTSTLRPRANAAESTDSLAVSCWNSDRTTPKQKAFLTFVGGEAKTITVPNTDRTEPTAEQTYTEAIALGIKNTGRDANLDPYAFTWALTNAVAETAVTSLLPPLSLSAPAAKVSVDGVDRNMHRIAAKDVVLVEGGNVVDYPVMVQRLRAGLGIK